ncbi:cytochrome p450 ii f2-like protein ii [Plakobranchus ocellatus]|uniref:Cytochrome p450 ii f2-like protein ii n=1 Tax=Plakobranchus ocellatus TaxID=259542 RepID=A0AAV4C6G3_9GAST|nr:cytochrome p450 ii f2-like protein ii [Plakobranchus ocellatus]
MLMNILEVMQDKMAGMLDSSGVTAALLVASLGILAYWVWSRMRPSYLGCNIPPFPAPKRFFSGHLHLWMKNNEIDNISAFREKVGDVFSLDLSGKLVVVINGYEALRQVLVKHWTEAADRPTTAAAYQLKEDNLGLVHARGENWKVQRTTSLLILKDFGMGKNIMAEKIGEEVRAFTDKLARLNAEPVDFRDLATTSVCSIICSIIVGKRFSSDDPYFVRLMGNLNVMFSKAPRLGLLEAFPLIRFLPWDFLGIQRWMRNILAIRENFSKAHINEAKENFDKDGVPQSFITSYLQKMRQYHAEDKPTKLDEENLITNIRGLFIAGTETTSTTIYWCVLFCLHHPEVQDKVFEEISTHVGQDRLPNIHDRPNLKYLDAVIMETQRCASLVPMLQRKVTQSFDFMGYTIPKDSLIILNIHSALHDTKPWGDPDKFRPERFLNADGKLIDFKEFLPFGLGPRSCLGKTLAKMELYLFLAAMFQRFKFEPETPSGELPPSTGHLSVILSPQPYKVRFVSR